MSCAESDDAGFILLEFVVAFGVLTLFLSSALAGFAVAMQGDRQSIFLIRATMIAQSKLASAGIDHPLRPGTESGRLSNGYTWHIHVRQYGPVHKPGPAVHGYWVEVTVTDPSSKGRRALSFAKVALSLDVER